MDNEFFSKTKQWEYTWNDKNIKLPIFFHDNTTLNVVYTASTKKVKELLPHPKMRPIEIYPGRCLVAFNAIEYRKSDLGPYNEVIISFPIVFDKPQIPFFTLAHQMIKNTYSSYLWQLPLNDDFAREGGISLFGYPKFMADVSIEKKDNWINCSVHQDGEKILNLKCKVLKTKKGKNTNYISYTMLDDIPIVTKSIQNSIEFAESNNKNDVELEIDTNHSIPTILRSIKLGKKPLTYQYVPKNQLILYPMRNIQDN